VTDHTPQSLDGITVVDLTRALAGPFTTLILAGLGARVIKVEDPRGGDFTRNNAPYIGPHGPKLIRDDPQDLSVSHLDRGRNKLAVTLNLKHAKSAAIFADLVRQADVVVENFSPNTADRLGVGYATARSIKPSIVYASISGFGPSTAEGTKAMDNIIQAMSGLTLMSGYATDPPMTVGTPLADLVAGVFAAVGTLAALRHAERTGVGQHVDVSMLGALCSLVAAEPAKLMERFGFPARNGPTLARLAPFGLYPCKDGWIAIASGQDKFTLSFFEDAMGRADLVQDARFSTRDMRVRHSRELNEIAAAWTQTLTVSEALLRLDAAGVPAGPARTPNEALADPLVLGDGSVAELSHPLYGKAEGVFGSGIPILFSETRASFDQPAAYLGEHNTLVYGQLLGYTSACLEELAHEGVI
jgi:crotonobetainyl-CoA:carnitine CoA-transferase CaiB-like acyl-CoA transferase